MENAFCIWLNGAAGSGKTTLAGLLANELARSGFSVEALDEETIRRNLAPSPDDMPDGLVINTAVYLAEILVRHNVVAIVAVPCPDAAMRRDIRDRTGRFVEIFLDCPEEIARDRSKTELGNLIEKPDTADIIVPTGGESPQDSLQRIMAGLEMLGLLRPAHDQEGYSDEEAELIQKRLTDLGYM